MARRPKAGGRSRQSNTGNFKDILNGVPLSGATITIDDAKVRQMLGDIARRGSDLKPALSAVGALIKESIRTNFARGGRLL